MNNVKYYKDMFREMDLNPKKIEYKGKSIILETDNKKVVVKEKNKKNKIYDYLSSRHFNYYPKTKFYKNFEIAEYKRNNQIPNEQKIIDLIELMALLHSKTTYYKEVTEDEYKVIYEDILNNIKHLESYYTDKINIIEKKIFMSPTEYLIARNFSKIMSAIYYSKDKLESWYNKVKEKKKIREVCIHNNLSLDHFIESDNVYFISWDKSKMGIPIFDFYILYQRHGLDFDFSDLLNIYEKKYPLLDEERTLLYILLALPNKLVEETEEYKLCNSNSKIIDLIYKTEYIISPQNSKERKEN